ncbi:hypothetical protein M440DRAFT_323905 [Trichoderma longibrachiatum ATCC 18648]|uniref:Uncharacterized protein n=1 Tax=Trichoderma longibrachiatum ATCC 18648 TaxID=983965 RepID=A0A2T4C1Q4_TRILO|nr:hypothetical protein M440DRAFT_323905 [Trichoderma longibrachiatum ATCC 18648]
MGISPRGSRPVEHGGCVDLIAAAFVSVTMVGYCLDVRETIKRSRPALSVAASLPFTSPPLPLRILYRLSDAAHLQCQWHKDTRPALPRAKGEYRKQGQLTREKRRDESESNGGKG